jgi:hypothetical protein
MSFAVICAFGSIATSSPAIKSSAIKMDEKYKLLAIDDADLEPLWGVFNQ